MGSMYPTRWATATPYAPAIIVRSRQRRSCAHLSIRLALLVSSLRDVTCPWPNSAPWHALRSLPSVAANPGAVELTSAGRTFRRRISASLQRARQPFEDGDAMQLLRSPHQEPSEIHPTPRNGYKSTVVGTSHVRHTEGDPEPDYSYSYFQFCD